MFTSFPYWDISYLVAITFTLGSVLWCINAFFVWLPLQVPSSEFNGEIANAGGITAFIGATIFEIGSVFLMLEAVNEKQEGCFGWAVESVLEEKGLIKVGKAECVHHHKNEVNLVGKGKELEGMCDILLLGMMLIGIQDDLRIMWECLRDNLRGIGPGCPLGKSCGHIISRRLVFLLVLPK
jgi:hypothetical protein